METPEKDPQKPQSLTHQAVKLYMKTGHLHRDVLEKEVRQTGVYRSQHQILMYLSNHPEASQKDIAEFLGVSTATIAVTLKKLEKAGYILRMSDPKDNRCNRILLSTKGEDIVTQSREIFFRVEKSMFLGFSEKEINELKNFFARMCENLEKINQNNNRRR